MEDEIFGADEMGEGQGGEGLGEEFVNSFGVFSFAFAWFLGVGLLVRISIRDLLDRVCLVDTFESVDFVHLVCFVVSSVDEESLGP